MCGRRTKKTFMVRALALAVMCLWGMIATGPALAECPGNILLNPGFDDGFSDRGAGEVTVANGWQPFWQDGPLQNDGFNHRPEYKPEDGTRFGLRRIREGYWAQKMFTTYATHHGGVFQQVNVPVGSTVRLTAWAQVWSSDKDNVESSSGGKYAVAVGIDPTGGTNFNAPSVVWSPRSETLDQYVQLAVEAKAQAGTVTVFLRGDAEFRVKHNDVYFDDACVTYSAPPPPTPKPTDTPLPTPTPTFTPTPEPTPVPAAPAEAPPAEASPAANQSAGVIRVQVFDDENGNGARDEGERLVNGAEVRLAYMQGSTLATLVTDGSTGPILLEGLQPGNYVLTEKDPPGYESTTPNEWAVTLVGGTQLEVYFADRLASALSPTVVPEPAAAPAAAPPQVAEVVAATEAPPVPEVAPAAAVESGGPLAKLWDALYGLSGLLVAGLAFALPFAIRYVQGHV